MVQIQINDVGIIVLEPENLRLLKAGAPIRVPIEHFKGIRVLAIDYTNDAMWLAEEIGKLEHDGSPEAIVELIKQSAERPEPELRPSHDPIFYAGPKKAGSA